MTASTRFVRVAVNAPPVRGAFDYHLPSELLDQVRPGHLVTVPFGRRTVQGVVLHLPSMPAVEETRSVNSLVDRNPVLTTGQLKLAEWLSHHMLTSLIDCLTLMIPPGLSKQADSLYQIVDSLAEPESDTQKRLVQLLRRRGPLRGRQIARALPRRRWQGAADSLIRRGALSRTPVLDPPSVGPKTLRTARLIVSPDRARASFGDLGRPGHAAAARRRAALELLIQEREPLELTWLFAEAGANRADLRYLAHRELISLSDAEVWRDPLEEVEYVPAAAPTLTSDQAAIWAELEPTLAAPSPESPTFLLHGVTGSGKTELYLRAVAEALKRGNSAIVLVPEISLTPQTVRRFLARFPGQVGLIHSQLSEGERYDTWRRARAGLLPVIIGPRSALFTPLPDIGVIVVDESHDDSYKEQARAPRYHAREAAIAYAEILGAVCILGSATPDLGTFYRSERGQPHRLELPKRILGHRERIQRQAERLEVLPRYRAGDSETQTIELPSIQVVDMRQELRAGNRSLFSRALQRSLAKALEAGQQAILFLNRRGSATHVFCRDCGWVARCPRCETPLTHHTDGGRLRCHHCGYERQAVDTCPDCRGDRVRHFGAGTQRIEAEVGEAFPQAQTIRWDADTARTKGSHEVILAHFANRRADVLIGTQMVAKGLDLPLVTLVGVISADTGLHLPDYRAAERTFQLLTQVAGRAGRGLLGGRVILQTYHPEHEAIQAAAAHDYHAFYRKELEHRRQLGYPPFRRLTRLLCRHTRDEKAEAEAQRVAKILRARLAPGSASDQLIGPAPAFYRRVRRLYRWQILLRHDDPTAVIPETLPEMWSVDVDPVSLL